MSSANGLIWIFIVFVVLVEFVSENNQDYHYRNSKNLSWGSYRFISFFKFNILILGRVIKEMVTMQQEKDKRSEQIRYGLLHRRKSGFRNVGSWNQLLL